MEDLIKRLWRWIVAMDDKYGCFSDPAPYPPAQEDLRARAQEG